MSSIILPPVAFIGGGNMASAIIGGLRKGGIPASHFEIVEPDTHARERISNEFGIAALPAAGPELKRCGLVVWAVKPQMFSVAAERAAPFVNDALHLSVAAGIPTASIADWIGTERIVRAMPNTPALVGQGVTGLFARSSVNDEGRAQIEKLLDPTGRLIWVGGDEDELDAVTAMSGSGPAYVFYFIEAMVEAGVEMGLTPEQSERLAIGTFTGASALAASASEPPAVLRERVTSKGGTTYAAITELQNTRTKQNFKSAMFAARRRAAELGAEFGGGTAGSASSKL